LNNLLDNERKARRKYEEDAESRAATELKGLGVLKKNLEEHVEDLHRWEKYLDVDNAGEVDFSGEVRPKLMLDISKTSFDDQLNTLANKLEKENDELQKLLKIKEEDQREKARKAAEKKAAPRR